MDPYKFKHRRKSPLYHTPPGPDHSIRPLFNFKHLAGAKPIPPDKRCRLNRSMQHLLEVYSEKFLRLFSSSSVDSNKTLPC
jgi:hypothetical protein